MTLRNRHEFALAPDKDAGSALLTGQMVRVRAAPSVLSVALTAGPSRAQPAEAAAPAPPVFADLIAELAPFVLRVLPRLGVASSDVEDVSQEVLLAVHRGLPRFEGRSSPRTWVYGICLRVARNHRDRAYVRRERPHAELPGLPGQDAAYAPVEPALDAKRLVAQLDTALSTLSPEQRETFVLHALEDLDVREIAAAQQVSKFTVYTRLYSAQRRLRAWFAEHAAGEEQQP